MPHDTSVIVRRLLHNGTIPQPLMRPLGVVVLDVLANQIVEVLLAEHQEVIEALDLQRLNQPLDVGVGVRRGW